MSVSYKRQELLTLREHLGSSPDFSGVRVPHFFFLFFFLCCVCLVLFCLSSSCVPNAASFSGLSILDSYVVFSNVYLVKIYPLSRKYCLIALKRLSIYIYIIIYLPSLDVSTDNGSRCNCLMLSWLTFLMYETVHMKTSKMQICLFRFIL